jgi:hypothetical protein
MMIIEMKWDGCREGDVAAPVPTTSRPHRAVGLTIVLWTLRMTLPPCSQQVERGCLTPMGTGRGHARCSPASSGSMASRRSAST